MEPGKRIIPALLFFFLFGIGMYPIAKKIAAVQNVELSGQEVKERFPEISVKSFWEGEFQARLDKWILKKVGLRNAFVRLDNQINFSFFNEVSSKYGSKIVLGKGRWLYEKCYIDSLNNRDQVHQSFLDDKVRSLKMLQDALEANGVYFLFLITPSKAAIYPEYIKDNYIAPKDSARESNYGRIIPLLQINRIHHIDGHQYLLELKKRSLYPVYPSSGTHWSFYSSCYFTLELISALENLTKQKMAKFQIDRIQVTNKPFSFDRDLAGLTNVFFEKSFYAEAYYYPETSSSVSVAENVFRPRMLFVGGSYLWNLFHYLEKHQVYSERDFYYYYNRNSKYPPETTGGIDKKTLDLKKELLAKDIVVIESNEDSLSQLGFGFIEDALKTLRPRD
jgi:hypothetical protein